METISNVTAMNRSTLGSRRSNPPRSDAPRAPGSSLDADALRRLLRTVHVTPLSAYLAKGRTIDDYRGAIWMYLDRYVKTGDLGALAKSILKTAALREHIEKTGSAEA